MNKKFSTLMATSLLMVGALFSNVNAQTNAKSLDLTDPTSYEAADLNKYYYIGLGTKAHYLTLDEITNTTNQKKYYSLKGVAPGVDNADLITEGDKALFKITVSKAGAQPVFTLTSKSGKTVQFNGTATLNATNTVAIAAADQADAVANYFSTINAVNFNGSTGAMLVPFHGATPVNTNELSLVTTAFSIVATSSPGGTNLVLYSIDENEMAAANLNELGNGTFSLTYKDATVSPFDGEMKAFDVSSGNASSWGVDEGTYLATSWGNLTTITSKADFQKCTFIALDSYKNWSINDLKEDGEGYKFTTVSGKKLMADASIELDDMKKGYVSSANAAFAVTEKDPVNAEGSYTISLAAAKFMNAKKEAVVTASDLIIAAVADQEDLIVTSVTDGNANLEDFTTTCTLANSNLISVDKLLSTKAASVFNVQFMSKQNVEDGVTDEKEYATKSEYNKFLGINEDGMFAQGSDFVNLEAPENQWIIVDADKDDKTFTFQNRELTDQTFTVKLIATGKTANTYKVVEATSAEFSYAYVDKEDGKYKIADKTTSNNDFFLNGTTIKLIAASVNPLAGYVTNELDNAGLVRFVFTSEQKTIADKLYVGAGATATANLEVSKDAADALKWSVVKFDASAEALDALVSDTIYAYNDYAYYDAAKKEVKVETAGDTIAVVAYGFKLYGKDKTYLSVNSNTLQPTTNNVEDAADAQRFLIKVNKNGSYSLIEVPTAEIDYREIVEAGTKAFTVDATDGTVEKAAGTPIYYDYKDIVYNFSIEKDAATPSLAHKPAYVTLNADNKGYVAMDSVNFDGIVAPVSLLKAAYTAEELTFRLDTADSEAYVPSFYISHIGKFMYNAKDSADYYNDGTASAEGNKLYKLVDDNAKAIFRAATLVSPDTLTTTVNGKEATVAVEESKGVLAGLNNFKYQIVQATADSEGEYVVKSVNDGYYLYNLNGFLGFTSDPAKALVVNVEQSQSPVANEAVTTSSIKVIAGNGVVTVIGAQGKKVAISNILGQTIANTVVSSDNETIAAPAGVVVVAVEGEAAVKAIVK